MLFAYSRTLINLHSSGVTLTCSCFHFYGFLDENMKKSKVFHLNRYSANNQRYILCNQKLNVCHYCIKIPSSLQRDCWRAFRITACCCWTEIINVRLKMKWFKCLKTNLISSHFDDNSYNKIPPFYWNVSLNLGYIHL